MICACAPPRYCPCGAELAGQPSAFYCAACQADIAAGLAEDRRQEDREITRRAAGSPRDVDVEGIGGRF